MKNVTPPPSFSQDPAAAFLREVDEAMQAERLYNLWHRYKWAVFGAALVLLVSVAALEGWQAWRQHQARTLAAKWYAWSEITDEKQRLAQLPALTAESSGGFKTLGLFAQADLAATPAEKAAFYKQVAQSRNPQWVKDLALLNSAITQLESNPTEAKSILEQLAQNNGETNPGPAFAPALELLSLMAQAQGDATTARGYTTKLLQQAQLTPDLRKRALQRLGHLSTLGK